MDTSKKTALIVLIVFVVVHIEYHFPRYLHAKSNLAYTESKRKEETRVEKEIVSIPKKKNSSFIEMFSTFPFKEYEDALEKQNTELSSVYTTMFLDHLTTYLIKEPMVAIDHTCKAPPLLNVSNIDCSAYPHGLRGEKRSKPAKIGHMIQFGFDVDVLEIHLREIYDVVDYFFILESTRSQTGLIRKSLMWENIRKQERFAIFDKKVVSIVVDDVDAIPPNQAEGKNLFYLENTQERIRWESFLRWNEKTKFFNNDDIIGFGDTDEVASRENLQLLKHCAITGPVDIGIWFPMGVIDQAFRTDFPVGRNPYTLGDPTFWPVHAAKEFGMKGTPSRRRGGSGKYLLGGMHLSDHRYLPFILAKKFTCSECQPHQHVINKIASFISNGKIIEMETHFGNMSPTNFAQRITKIDKIKNYLKDVRVLPWFYACNKERYRYWELKHDYRLD